MIAALVLACLVATGLLLSDVLLRPRHATERVAFALLLALTVVPFAAVATALVASVRLSELVLLGVALPVTGAAGLAWLRARRTPPTLATDLPDVAVLRRADGPLLVGAAVVAAAAALYYTHAEVLLSLASYVARGEAKCFYMLTFRLLEDLNPGLPFAPLADVYGIISTPGNAVFTAPFVPLLGARAFQAVYAAVQVLTFLFVALGALRWTGRRWIALAAGAFAVAGPYALSIEVLDRNAIALAMTAALVYTLETRPPRAVLHGWLFAVAAGTGLRFLPLLNVIVVAAAYRAHRAPARRWLAFGVTAVAAFAPNLPHLGFHGFHSLGESLPAWELARLALTEGYRAPFQPYPPGLQVLLQALAHLGLLGAAAVLTGAVRAWTVRRREGGALVLVLVAVWAVLATQRDAMEGDKARILLSAWLPVPLFLALALEQLTAAGARRRTALLLAAALAITLGVDHGLRKVRAPVDPGSAARKPTYPSDTEALAAFLRAQTAPLGLAPDWSGLGDKLDLRRKAAIERATAATLAATALPVLPAEDAWAARAFQVAPPEPAAPPDEQRDASTLRIDLERLVAEPEAAVTLAAPDAVPFADLTDADGLLDVYAARAHVSWQPQPLPVALFPHRLEHVATGDVVVHLNAFTPLGRDAEGFERVNAIQYDRTFQSRAEGRRTGLRALPSPDLDGAFVLRVPAGARVLVLNWLVDLAKGTPFRVDSWEITPALEGAPIVRFRPGEPESYL